MTGPEHLRRAEGLAAKAAEYLGQGDGQAAAAVWAAVAQVHATLAVAAAHNPDSAVARNRPRLWLLDDDGKDWIKKTQKTNKIAQDPLA